jgi:acylphosphatase
LHVRLHGRVQGVGFRDAAQHRAMALRVVGWVRNLSDGTLQVYARGDIDAVAAMRGWLASGPPAARVERVEELPATGEQRALCPAHHFVRLPDAPA